MTDEDGTQPPDDPFVVADSASRQSALRQGATQDAVHTQPQTTSRRTHQPPAPHTVHPNRRASAAAAPSIRNPSFRPANKSAQPSKPGWKSVNPAHQSELLELIRQHAYTELGLVMRESAVPAGPPTAAIGPASRGSARPAPALAARQRPSPAQQPSADPQAQPQQRSARAVAAAPIDTRTATAQQQQRGVTAPAAATTAVLKRAAPAAASAAQAPLKRQPLLSESRDVHVQPLPAEATAEERPSSSRPAGIAEGMSPLRAVQLASTPAGAEAPADPGKGGSKVGQYDRPWRLHMRKPGSAAATAPSAADAAAASAGHAVGSAAFDVKAALREAVAAPEEASAKAAADLEAKSVLKAFMVKKRKQVSVPSPEELMRVPAPGGSCSPELPCTFALGALISHSDWHVCAALLPIALFSPHVCSSVQTQAADTPPSLSSEPR